MSKQPEIVFSSSTTEIVVQVPPVVKIKDFLCLGPLGSISGEFDFSRVPVGNQEYFLKILLSKCEYR